MTYHIPLLIAAIILGWVAWIVIYSEQTQTERNDGGKLYIRDGKIVKADKPALLIYWMRSGLDYVVSFDEYIDRLKDMGVKIRGDKE
jgi:hypothetical protein